MSTSRPFENVIRYFLSLLLFLVAINAFGGGYYGITGAKDVPIEWLNGSPFRNYFIPSLFLLIAVGAPALIAAILVFRRHRLARRAALACGVLILLWLMAQVAIIGYVSWMQPTTAVAATIILLLAFQLPGHDN